jgi:hypothetical protein
MLWNRFLPEKSFILCRYKTERKKERGRREGKE